MTDQGAVGADGGVHDRAGQRVGVGVAVSPPVFLPWLLARDGVKPSNQMLTADGVMASSP